ncbi:MAG: TetR/AcrR family transcriptional regulator [Frankiaceae bacterium]|nr:TetR/AcrR family transcriptional regulator [Frankiaceae bacterium]MBV9872154.1 TetR/AcrR family transcriptional regulator [Frankiaceae bacterium]
MPARIRTPRSSWVDAGLSALSVGGPDAIRIEALAQTLGVTKGGFYWHFADRQALLDEMLDTWERVVSDDVITLVEAHGGDARGKLRHLFSIAEAINEMTAIELAIREWARRDPTVDTRLRRLDNRRMAFMTSLFTELGADRRDAEARSYLAFSLFIGNHYVHAAGSGRSRRRFIEQSVQHLLA